MERRYYDSEAWGTGYVTSIGRVTSLDPLEVTGLSTGAVRCGYMSCWCYSYTSKVHPQSMRVEVRPMNEVPPFFSLAASQIESADTPVNAPSPPTLVYPPVPPCSPMYSPVPPGTSLYPPVHPLHPPAPPPVPPVPPCILTRLVVMACFITGPNPAAHPISAILGRCVQPSTMRTWDRDSKWWETGR